MTRISLIAAMTSEQVIGHNNAMPWHIPEELLYFKTMTMGKPMIMGRKTFDSLGRKALPGRTTIVLTQDKDFVDSNVRVARNLEEAIRLAGDVPEIMVVGGAGIYQQFLPRADRLYLSIIEEDYKGDTFFPTINDKDWRVTKTEQQEKFETLILERTKFE